MDVGWLEADTDEAGELNKETREELRLYLGHVNVSDPKASIVGAAMASHWDDHDWVHEAIEMLAVCRPLFEDS